MGQNMKLTVKMSFTCILLFTCISGAFAMTWVWLLAFGFPWTRSSVHIYDITVLLIWHGFKQYFDSEIRQIDKVCVDALLTFFSARLLWRSPICKLACAPGVCVPLILRIFLTIINFFDDPWCSGVFRNVPSFIDPQNRRRQLIHSLSVV